MITIVKEVVPNGPKIVFVATYADYVHFEISSSQPSFVKSLFLTISIPCSVICNRLPRKKYYFSLLRVARYVQLKSFEPSARDESLIGQ